MSFTTRTRGTYQRPSSAWRDPNAHGASRDVPMECWSLGLLRGSDQLLPWLLLVVVRHMPILAKLATHLIAVLSNDYAVCLLPVAFNNSRPLVASVVRVLLVASWVHMEMGGD
jgi:hypothetical protein